MPDDVDPNKIQILLDLERLGELIGVVATAFADIRGVESFTPEEGRELAAAGWNHVVFMHDRADFARSVSTDLAQLETQESVTQDSE